MMHRMGSREDEMAKLRKAAQDAEKAKAAAEERLSSTSEEPSLL